ncbi:hypothetical protein [Dyadobacter psychrotolerans]|uniref:Lipoprotein SmpA/OmlA domain-containing protein n=1 Tax=Dyadobacter psychrotolerans TaxID=2541721 RepID=A0A4R5DHX6_9BACT|nr:hypothetical protein [Dyadobacter psychrotolerans]TDE13656.1 hypothetical protein E0F88_17270 [Dyadobacter psychrotolerans]
MKIKNTVIALLIICFLNACAMNNIAWKTNENIKKVEIGMTKEQVIQILGNKYMITASSKSNQGHAVEVLGYKSDTDEEYKLTFISNKLTEWNREHVNKYVVKDSE